MEGAGRARSRRPVTARIPSVLSGTGPVHGWSAPPTLLDWWREDPLAQSIRRVAGPGIVLLVVQQLVFPMPFGIVLYGMVLGVLGALVAVGMALVHRANRILNFAQAQLGVVPTALAASLMLFSGVTYALALLAGLVSAILMGACIEFFVIRRFFKAPRLILTVATIGLSQVLAVTALLLPALWGQDPISITTGSISVPARFTFSVAPMRFEADHLLALVLAPLALAAVSNFLRRTRTGLAVRASAERADRASLLGIPVQRVNTIVWVLAAVLSFLGVFLRAAILGLPLSNPLLGFAAALAALAALVLGRFDDLPAVAVSAVALGVLEQGVIWNHGDNPELVYPVFAIVVLGTLAWRRTGRSRSERDDTSTWQSSDDVRPVPPALRAVPLVRSARLLGAGLAIAAAAIVPAMLGPGEQVKASAVVVWALVGLSVVVLTGWAGQVSLGQMSFAGVGAGIGTLALVQFGWDMSLAIVAAALAGAVAAVLVGLPALRLKGIFLAATTLAFAVASSSYLLSQRHLQWIPRERIERVKFFGIEVGTPLSQHLMSVAVASLVFAAVLGIRRSRTGRALVAIRENETVAAAHGLNATRVKLSGFALSGAIAAVGGCLYTVITRGYSETLFTPTESVAAFSATVVGGAGSMAGAVVGALFARGGAWFLTGSWVYLPTAAGMLLVLWLLPGGLSSLGYRARNRWLAGLASRHGIDVPGLRGRSYSASTAAATTPTTPTVGIAPTTAPVPPGSTDRGVLLSVQDLCVAYNGVQVLFGVSLDVHDGEILALLGTNGAGKSTVLKAVCGQAPITRGHVRLASRAGGPLDEITGRAAHRLAATGISLLPGGRGVFGSLTVEENLRAACWLDQARIDERIDEVLERFPALRSRLDEPAVNLSGGQQQMLSLAMAFLTKPRLLLLDELSLGLAPAIVEQLLTHVRDLAATGVTVVIVEQSVQLALRLADRAVFLEKGEVRFSGPTADLLDRPDVLRSVYLEGAASGLAGVAAPAATDPDDEIATAALASALIDADDLATRTGIGIAAPRLEVRGITVSFGGVRALDDVSFEVEPGEILGFIGPNGAGKTTLLDVFSGSTTADHGAVLADGVDVLAVGADERARHGIARSFQDASLYPNLTVEDTIATALDRWLTVKDPMRAAVRAPALRREEAEIAERVDELISLLGLDGYRGRFVRELSTGTRRLVDLACVLAQHPTVVLLDEPSSGIAQREAEALVPLLRRVRDVLGATVLVVEHDMGVLAGIADRLVALDQGRIVAVGTPAEVLAHPMVVRSYLGAAADGPDLAPTADAPDRADGAPPAEPPVGGHPGRGRRGRGRHPRAVRGRVPTAVLVAIALVVVAAATNGTGRDGGITKPTALASKPVAAEKTYPVPPTYAESKDKDAVQWVDNCDKKTGRIMMPSVFAPPCVPRFEGDNGGATYPGVTSDKVTIAVYSPQGANDIRAVLQNLVDDPAAIEATGRSFAEMLNDLFETYGRKVELVEFPATGAMDDEVAARADAIKLIEEIGPFASLGGPALTGAYAEELAAHGVLCIDCSLSEPDSFFQRNAPYLWGPLPTPEEFLLSVGDELFNRVVDRPASFAGSEDLRSQTRTFGTVHFEQKVPVFQDLERLVNMIGQSRGFVPKVSETYTFDLEKMPERATTIVAKLKAANVTTVVFLGDPLMPIYLTKAATEQDYFPEWFVTGTVLTDTTVFGRRYDPQQWAHAFGVSPLPAQTRKELGESYRLHQWYHGTPPAAVNTQQIIYQGVMHLFLGVHMAGPNLRPETFRDGLFHYPASGGGPTTPRISFGRNGLYISEDLGKRVDYLGVDDMTEIWWDADAEGPDETGAQGKGMWRYVKGGQRYLPGDFPKTDTDAFRLEDSILIYDELPEVDRPPSYPRPAH